MTDVESLKNAVVMAAQRFRCALIARQESGCDPSRPDAVMAVGKASASLMDALDALESTGFDFGDERDARA